MPQQAPVGVPVLFVGWSCATPPAALPAAGALPLATPWDVRLLPEGLRCKLVASGSTGSELGTACADRRSGVGREA